MSSREFSEWQAYHRHNPFTESRDDLRAALIAWSIFETAAPIKGKQRNIKDFMLEFDPYAKPEDKKANLVDKILGAFNLRNDG